MHGQIKTAVVGTGSYLPEKVLTNADLERMVDTTDEWIQTRTGIKERHIASPDEATSDLATQAASRALESANVEAGEVDLIIVATCTPDMLLPATACIVQHNIKAHKAVAFDLEAACSGFIYALSVASNLISSGIYHTALIIGAETFSRFIDWKDRSTCVLLGDGAGAVVLRATPKSNGLLDFYLGADGGGAEYMKIPAGGSRLPASHDVINQRLHYFQMRGNETFKAAIKLMSYSTKRVLKQSGLSIADVDYLIPHQANVRIMEAVAKRLSLPLDKIIINIQSCGNTSAATIPIALDQAVREGKIADGNLIVLVSFGAGLTWGACAIKW